MPARSSLTRVLIVPALLAGVLFHPATARAGDIPSYEFATPILGLASAPDASLLVADAGAGIVELRKGEGSLIAQLPAVADMAPIGRGSMYAVTGFSDGAETDDSLLRVSHGRIDSVADLFAFEAEFNPDGDLLESNPFDVAALPGGKALVADAEANDLLIVGQSGKVDWVATLPEEMVSTDDIKDLVGCPDPAPGFEWVCDLPEMLEADPVATGVTIGPDGAYYVSELKGFPAPRNESKVWRIEPGTRHAECGISPDCSVVADGFTSIVDLTSGPDGTVYVTELDEATWFAVESGLPLLGGTVNACDPDGWTCSELATDLLMSIAAAVDKGGTVYAAVNALIPGEAEIVALT
jgi:hypothetical protein